jgi:hypothetical protein
MVGGDVDIAGSGRTTAAYGSRFVLDWDFRHIDMARAPSARSSTVGVGLLTALSALSLVHLALVAARRRPPDDAPGPTKLAHSGGRLGVFLRGLRLAMLVAYAGAVVVAGRSPTAHLAPLAAVFVRRSFHFRRSRLMHPSVLRVRTCGAVASCLPQMATTR